MTVTGMPPPYNTTLNQAESSEFSSQGAFATAPAAETVLNNSMATEVTTKTVILLGHNRQQHLPPPFWFDNDSNLSTRKRSGTMQQNSSKATASMDRCLARIVQRMM